MLFWSLVVVNQGCTHDLLFENQKLNRSALVEIEKETSKKRHLPLLKKIPVHVYTKKESEIFFTKKDKENKAALVKEQYRLQDVVAHRLGLLSPKIRLANVFGKALAQNAAGVYRPKSGTLFVVSDLYPGILRVPLWAFSVATGVDWNNEHIISHEIVHGLQDQHFGLQTLLPSAAYAENEDQALAIKSILESEANVVANAISLGIDLDKRIPRALLLNYLLGMSNLNVWLTRLNTPYLPSFYAKLFTEQYTLALPYLLSVTSNKGFSGLNEAYRNNLPLSSEQLLHPQKLKSAFLDEPRIPVELLAEENQILLPNFKKNRAIVEKNHKIQAQQLTTPSFIRIESNVFGEFLWRILFEDSSSPNVAADAAEGWGGDRYTIYEEVLPDYLKDKLEKDDEKLKEVASRRRNILLWRVWLDSENDAIEFAKAVRSFLFKNAAMIGDIQKKSFQRKGKDNLRIDVNVKLPILKGSELAQKPVESFAFVRDGNYVALVMGAHPVRLQSWMSFALKNRNIKKVSLRKSKPVSTDNGSDFFVEDLKNIQKDSAGFRLHMPHRQMSYRLEAGIEMQGFVLVTDSSRPMLQNIEQEISVFPLRNAQIRIGIRQFLSLTLPLTLSLDLTSAIYSRGKRSIEHGPLQTLIGIGLKDLSLEDNRAGLVARALIGGFFTQRIRLYSGVSWVAQMQTDVLFTSDAHLENLFKLRLSTGFMLQPLASLPSSWGFEGDRLLFSPAISVRSSMQTLHWQKFNEFSYKILVGSAFEQDFFTLPLVEYLLFDGFYLTATAQLIFSLKEKQTVSAKALLGIQLKL